MNIKNLQYVLIKNLKNFTSKREKFDFEKSVNISLTILMDISVKIKILIKIHA